MEIRDKAVVDPWHRGTQDQETKEVRVQAMNPETQGASTADFCCIHSSPPPPLPIAS